MFGALLLASRFSLLALNSFSLTIEKASVLSAASRHQQVTSSRIPLNLACCAVAF